jgi:hypothetical protein
VKIIRFSAAISFCIDLFSALRPNLGRILSTLDLRARGDAGPFIFAARSSSLLPQSSGSFAILAAILRALLARAEHR